MTDITLTPDQGRALTEISVARMRGERHLLTGYAGSGKTTLMQEVTRTLRKEKLDVVLTAPTHKAVAVLSTKLARAGIDDVPCSTIHSLLSLRPKPDGDRMVFIRDRRAEPVEADVVVVDECSMIGTELFRHIRRHLPRAFVLFVGDPAQLPPVDEAASPTFDIKARSHLDTIVRQAAGNPVLEAATAIRAMQGGEMSWDWCKPARAPPMGVYLPGAATDAWMKKAFTSTEFEEDPDTHRYLAWTNRRVAEVNARIRRWRYGDNIPTPFMPGERALLRAPVFIDRECQFSTNEEATVVTIARSTFRYEFEAGIGVPQWTAEIPSWRIVLRRNDGAEIPMHMPSDERAFNDVVDRIKDEAADWRERWAHLHDFKSALARLQSVYAMTIHTSQGSTFRNVFLDVSDVKKRQGSNLLETQQLLYTGATRPSHALMLLGV
jgi:exodeoxyribonuclease-5